MHLGHGSVAAAEPWEGLDLLEPRLLLSAYIATIGELDALDVGVARAAAMSDLDGGVVPLLDDLDEYVVDDFGNGHVRDPSLDPLALLVSEEQQAADLAARPYALSETFFLHSNPGAKKVIYLDFDGHTTTGTRWNNSKRETIVTPAFSFKGGSGFTRAELERIQKIWERVAEDFIPFNVDVTTEDPGVAALINSGGGDKRWGIRVAIGGSWNNWHGASSGVAYRN